MTASMGIVWLRRVFAAFAELVGTYGEDAVAKFVEGLAGRVRNGEFSLIGAKQ